MKTQWQQWAARFDGLQRRERWMVVIAVLGGIVLVGYSLFVEPDVKRTQLAERNVLEYRSQIASMQAQQVELQLPNQGPEAAARVELDAVRKQLGDIAGRLEVMENSLAPPQRMSGLLEDMIGRQPGLHLVSLKTLLVVPLQEKKTADDDSSAIKPLIKSPVVSSGLFKHGVEIKLEGSYQDLAAYLERLEQAKMKLLWSSVSVSADKHPKLVLTLTVFTLSLDRAWLIV